MDGQLLEKLARHLGTKSQESLDMADVAESGGDQQGYLICMVVAGVLAGLATSILETLGE